HLTSPLFPYTTLFRSKLYLIWFVFFFKIFDGFVSWLFRSGKRKIFLYDLFHFFFNFFQIFCCKLSLSVYIIVKTVCHRRTDGQRSEEHTSELQSRFDL